MKKTEGYNLNVIETMDTFSPDPLNENTALLEQALDAANAGTAAEAKARAAAVSAVEKRVAALEARRFVYGTYTGNGEKIGDSQTIKLGFTPNVVFVSNGNQFSWSAGYMAMTGHPVDNLLEIVTNGFTVYGFQHTSGSYTSANNKGKVHHYVALKW